MCVSEILCEQASLSKGAHAYAPTNANALWLEKCRGYCNSVSKLHKTLMCLQFYLWEFQFIGSGLSKGENSDLQMSIDTFFQFLLLATSNRFKLWFQSLDEYFQITAIILFTSLENNQPFSAKCPSKNYYGSQFPISSFSSCIQLCVTLESWEVKILPFAERASCGHVNKSTLGFKLQ